MSDIPSKRRPPAAQSTGPRGAFRSKFADPSKVEWVDPDTLLAHPDNWRIHPEHQRAIMRGVLSELGWTDRVKVSRRTGRHDLIIDGHLRTMLSKAAGEKVPVEPLTLTDDEERIALASHDALTALSEADYSAVQRNLNEIRHDGPAGSDAMVGLFDDLEAQAREALELAAQYVGRDKTNFDSVQKSFSERKVVIKAVYLIDEAELVERAIAATGKINRAEAIQELARVYLQWQGVDSNDRDSASQLDRGGEDRVAAELAGAAGNR
jgi:hypothetical protein